MLKFLNERDANVFSTQYKVTKDKNDNTSLINRNNIIIEDKPLFKSSQGKWWSAAPELVYYMEYENSLYIKQEQKVLKTSAPRVNFMFSKQKSKNRLK